MKIIEKSDLKNKSELCFSVRYCETDQMGVANHGRYFDWYSEGRVKWLRDLGYEYSAWEKQKIVLPVIHLTADYKKSAYFQQNLQLFTKMTKISKKSINFSYELFHESQMIATGTTNHLFLIDGKVSCVDNVIYLKLKGVLE
ncbi:MAG: thioesterase [Candidatus Cloacimonadota bacterium]|nr:MAG: thioesterase [Candidatus Cloacimonadota bacterium]